MSARAPQGAAKALVKAYMASDRLLGALEEGAGPCRLWPYSKTAKGYGHVYGFHSRRVHRLILEAHVGPPYMGICKISGKLALKDNAAHSCKNKHCSAVAHLSWKTGAENQADRLRDGTDARGEKHVLSKLTDTAVLDIRARYATGRITQLGLAEEYGVSFSLISQIVRRKKWAHLQNHQKDNS